MKKPTVLIVMDGYGIAPDSPGNAIAAARTPVLDELYRTCPHTTLSASGEDVGLPRGQMGNSEVGHTNIGAGRIVYQDLLRIDNDIADYQFFENPVLSGVMHRCAVKGKKLHVMGLVSPGGVHSHTEHLYALIKMAHDFHGLGCYIHCFTDGRDVSPTSAREFLAALQDKCNEIGAGGIATVMGRYWAMDREENYERTARAYACLTRGEGERNLDPIAAVENSYSGGVTDEFIAPVVCTYEDSTIGRGDGVIFFNFRPDRARQLTRAFTDPNFDGFPREYMPVDFVCMTEYDETMPNVTVAYPPEHLRGTLGETVAAHGLTQLRTAETTKYAHVTYFLNGGSEDVFAGEDRLLVPTPTEYPTYDLIPQMSAFKVAEQAAARVRSGEYDLVVINFANCDMVGHTGVFDAAVAAVEAVDACVGTVLAAVRDMGGAALICSDHGNAESMGEGGEPMTAHTTNLVPLILAGAEGTLRPGRLCDIAPTVLALMGVAQPAVMTGVSLLTP